MATELIMKWPDQIHNENLIHGVGGAFEVTVDGKQVWSKLATKQYPDFKVVTDAVTAALG
jgi:selT/selW/selH-like putative selenoprotein